jgi:Fe-S cluster assembly iron-binding protein IscA
MCYKPPQILSNASMDFIDLNHEKKVKLNNGLKIKMRCIRGENYA